MPKYQKSKGPDRLQYYTRLEIRKLYQDEGVSTKGAIKKASLLYWELLALNAKEAYSWNKARELEMPFGVGETLHELYTATAFDYHGIDADHELTEKMDPDFSEVFCDSGAFNGEAHWYGAGIMAAGRSDDMPRHYEKLKGGKRLRMEPELKKARAEKRKQEMKRILEKYPHLRFFPNLGKC